MSNNGPESEICVYLPIYPLDPTVHISFTADYGAKYFFFSSSSLKIGGKCISFAHLLLPCLFIF